MFANCASFNYKDVMWIDGHMVSFLSFDQLNLLEDEEHRKSGRPVSNFSFCPPSSIVCCSVCEGFLSEASLGLGCFASLGL